jgi:hypothetical protein
MGLRSDPYEDILPRDGVGGGGDHDQANGHRDGRGEFAYDGDGHLLFRARMDDEARAIALLDDHRQARRN